MKADILTNKSFIKEKESEVSVVADQASLMISKIRRHIVEDGCTCCKEAIK